MQSKCTAICDACGLEFQTSPSRPAKTCSPACQYPSPTARLLEHAVTEGECLVWTGGRDEDGYGLIWDRGKYTKAHRLALEIRIGRPLAAGEHSLHRCDNPPCFRPSHLFVGTNLVNQADKIAKMRYTKGEEHPRSKLTPDQVLTILTRLSNGEQLTRLAQEYGVSRGLIGHIKRGRNWRHLRPPTAEP